MLKVFNLKKSTYYYTLNTMKNDKDVELKQEILAIFQEISQDTDIEELL